MKIAYLIIAHGNYRHLDRLIAALDDPGISFFLHLDQKANEIYQPKRPNVEAIKERVNVNWGCFGMVQATLNLMKAAWKNSAFDYYILISGADYPIRQNKFLYKLVDAQKHQFINSKEAPLPHKPFSRFENYYFNYNRKKKGFKERWLKKIEELLPKLWVKKQLKFKIYVGSSWFALTGSCVQYILETVEKHPEYIRFFKTSLHPDEAFFQTIIGNSSFNQLSKNNITYAQWSKKSSPDMITRKQVALFQDQTEFEESYGKYTPFFARKFDDDSHKVVADIEALLRNPKPGLKPEK